MIEGAPVNVKDYGVVGDGVTDDTAAFNAFYTAGGRYINNGTYLIDSFETSSSNITLVGESTEGVIIKARGSVSGALDFLKFTGSNVTIRNITVDLNNTTDTFAGGFIAGRNGIVFLGLVGAFITNITLDNVSVINCGEAGIKPQYVNGLKIINTYIERCGQYGIYGLSVIDAQIEKPKIKNIFPGNGGTTPYLNAYGLTASSEGTDPVSTDWAVYDGNVEDVTSWEAYDTHKGKRIRFYNCSSKNCSQGVAIESTSAGYESEDIIVSGGSHTSFGQAFVRDGQTYEPEPAVVANMGSTTTNGKGLSITGVTSRGHGSGRNSSGGAIKIQDADGVIITGNVLIDSLKRGISIVNEGKNLLLDDNLISGVTSVGSVGRGIEFTPTLISGRIGNRNVIVVTPNQTSYNDEVTIAAGVLTVFMDQHHIDTEADAATDDLNTITAGWNGQTVKLTTFDSARTVVLKDGIGNLRLAGDFSLTHSYDKITLSYDERYAVWSEDSRSNNEI